METFRPLLPVGYQAGVEAYRAAVADLTVRDLSRHYTDGLGWFRSEFVRYLKGVMRRLTGGAWDLQDFEAYAAGSDVDFMTHLVEAVAAQEGVSIFPGDWFGFQSGCTQTDGIHWDTQGEGRLACLCVPSVRNGHVTEEMASFLESSRACLLNINLFPTLRATERHAVAARLEGILDKAVVSISFSRGFGLTASQLGVVLIHRDHPYRRRFARQWEWFTYFHNALAERAFMALDLSRLEAVDDARRDWVLAWLQERGLPIVSSGTYYLKAFRLVDGTAGYLDPLNRDGIVRLCFKPPVFS